MAEFDFEFEGIYDLSLQNIVNQIYRFLVNPINI